MRSRPKRVVEADVEDVEEVEVVEEEERRERGGARGAGRAEWRGEREEDVLEETPEFLQDSPEHDRLWFEQKPPKDFDFDD